MFSYKFKLFMNSMNKYNDMHTKFYFWHLSIIIFFSFFLTSFVKADEYSDLRKIGFYKEKIDTIYLELLSVYDSVLLLDDIITKLEDDTINKKEAMTQGVQIINDTKQIIEEAENKLSNLEPLVVSTSELKAIENIYGETKNYLSNQVQPNVKEIILLSEETFFNALKGKFVSFEKRWIESLRKSIILVEGENQFIKITVAALVKGDPKIGIYQATIESNKFAIQLVSTMIFIVENPEANDQVLLKYFTELEMNLAEIIKKTETALKTTKLDIINMEAEFEKMILSDADKNFIRSFIKIIEESLAVEQTILRGMKKNAKTFTYKNFKENEDLVNQLEDGLGEMSTYSYLRENVEKKTAQLLQDIEN